jgi:hypothetical protein
MSTLVPAAATVSEAWLNTLRVVHEAGDAAVHTVTTVTAPGTEHDGVRTFLDEFLAPGRRPSGTNVQPVSTVASTLFPQALYHSPGFAWDPALTGAQAEVHDDAAEALFAAYDDMLPMLRTAQGNNRGTYFGRMTNWPGTDVRTNQLADRITYLRRARGRNLSRSNLSDIAVAGDGSLTDDPDPAAGLQVYAATDRREYGFPCLVHIDLSVQGGRLHLLAVYRHWYLVTKGYGNLLGLSRLLSFLGEQTGYPTGELVAVAGMADCEPATYGHRRGIAELVDKATTVLGGSE